jgi:hypothetical protein
MLREKPMERPFSLTRPMKKRGKEQPQLRLKPFSFERELLCIEAKRP